MTGEVVCAVCSGVRTNLHWFSASHLCALAFCTPYCKRSRRHCNFSMPKAIVSSLQYAPEVPWPDLSSKSLSFALLHPPPELEKALSECATLCSGHDYIDSPNTSRHSILNNAMGPPVDYHQMYPAVSLEVELQNCQPNVTSSDPASDCIAS